MSKASALVQALTHITGKMLDNDMKDHAFARRMQGEVNRLRGGAEALHRVSTNRSPLDTPAAHAVKVAKMAKKFDSEITAALNRAIVAHREGHQDAQRRIDEKVNLKPDAFAAEIRDYVRTLSRTEKLDLMHKLVKENRGPELAAIVKAPSLATGIADEIRARFERSIVAEHAPAELDEQARLEEMLEMTVTATNAAGKLAQSLNDPAELTRIEMGEAAANEAGASFEQALSTE